MMAGSLDGFEEIMGMASGKVEGRETSALLPFVFRLKPLDSTLLLIVATDFHDHTWQSIWTVRRLDDLRDEIGIGGSWEDFLAYLQDAFRSDNVTLWLGGPASVVGGYGATSAKVTAQKSRGTPRISVTLTKLTGPEAKDAIGDIGIQLCWNLRKLSGDLVAEQERSLRMSVALEAEKASNTRLQAQVDSMGFGGKKKWRTAQLSQSLARESDDLSSQLPTTDLVTASTSLPFDDVQLSGSAPKTKPSRTKVRVAPTSVRAKRRGTAIGGDD